MADYAKQFEREVVDSDYDRQNPQYSGVVLLPGFSSFGASPASGQIGKKYSVFNARNQPRPEKGLASVSLNIKNIRTAASEQDYNYRILCDLTWQAGNGGGEATIDIQRGGVFTVAGAESIQAKVYYAIQDPRLPFVAPHYKQVDGVVRWHGSVNPEKAFMTDETVLIADGGTSTPVRIPLCARSMMVMASPFASLSGLTAEFLQRETGRVISTVTDPFSNGSPIAAGAEFVQFANTSGGNIIMYPVYELWL